MSLGINNIHSVNQIKIKTKYINNTEQFIKDLSSSGIQTIVDEKSVRIPISGNPKLTQSNLEFILAITYARCSSFDIKI